MTRTLYPFQEVAVELGMQRNVLLNDSCGTGKTTMAAGLILRTRDELHLPTLYIAPKRSKEQVRQELIQVGLPAEAIAIGTVDPLWVPDIPDWILIIHYEAAVRHVRALSKAQFGTIIVDEAHHIKNPQAQRSRCIKRFKSARKMVMTGTPMEKVPQDLHSLLEFLYPEKYRGTRQEWCRIYVRSYWDPRGFPGVLSGAKDPERLAKEIAPFTLARTKEQVRPDLPPNIITHVPIVMDGEQAALYRRIKKSVDLEVCGPELSNPLYVPSRLAQILRLQQVAVDPRLINSQVASAKLEWLDDFMQDNPEEPVLIFTNFRQTAKYIAEKYKAQLIVGGMKPLDPDFLRAQNRVVMTIASGEALSLGWLKTAIFLDTNWRWGLMAQALDRIHRIDITEPRHTIYLQAQGSIDHLIMNSSQGKWDHFKLIQEYVRSSTREEGAEP